MHERRAEEIEEMLQEVDTNAYLLWIGYDLFNIVQTPYFRNINLVDTYGDYSTDMVIRYDHISDSLTISFTKQCKHA